MNVGDKDRFAKQLALTTLVLQLLIFIGISILAFRAGNQVKGAPHGASGLVLIVALALASSVFAVLAFRSAPTRAVRRAFLLLSISSVVLAAGFAALWLF
jgi:hypothetical protein